MKHRCVSWVTFCPLDPKLEAEEANSLDFPTYADQKKKSRWPEERIMSGGKEMTQYCRG
jgi:hypothetical protein